MFEHVLNIRENRKEQMMSSEKSSKICRLNPAIDKYMYDHHFLLIFFVLQLGLSNVLSSIQNYIKLLPIKSILFYLSQIKINKIFSSIK
jgi:hypothetical protein